MPTDTAAARQGLMKFLAKKGGSLPMRELHTHSLGVLPGRPPGLLATDGGLVADELVTYDEAGGVFALTDKAGRHVTDRVIRG